VLPSSFQTLFVSKLHLRLKCGGWLCWWNSKRSLKLPSNFKIWKESADRNPKSCQASFICCSSRGSRGFTLPRAQVGTWTTWTLYPWTLTRSTSLCVMGSRRFLRTGTLIAILDMFSAILTLFGAGSFCVGRRPAKNQVKEKAKWNPFKHKRNPQ